VLDTARGCPASGIAVVLERGGSQEQWQLIGHGETDADGRLKSLVSDGSAAPPGLYRLVFDTRRHFERLGVRSFYPTVIIVFEASADEHYHVPLLLSPFGYTTYRGS
jgi:5-hydroxyisourate hydrolase